MGQHGKIAGDEVVSRWENDVDELQQEDWEDVTGGPDDEHFESMDDLADPSYEPPDNGGDIYLPPKGEYMGPSDEEMKEYGLMDDKYEIMIIPATKRQEKIAAWLADSTLAEPFRSGSRSDFMVREGSPVLLQGGVSVELLSWLEREGFEDRLMVNGYTVTKGLDRRGAGVVMVFRKKEVVKAPFKFEEPPSFDAEPAEVEKDVQLPNDDIPF